MTGQNLIQATGSGSITLKGQSGGGSGINIYPSGTGNSLTLSTVSGDLSLTGISIADQVNIDVAQWRYVSDTGTAAPRSSSKIERE